MQLLVVIFSLVALVWLAIFVLRGSLLAGCVLLILVAAIFGHPFFHTELGPIPITLDRLVLPVLIATYVVQWRLGRAEPKPLTRTEWILFALLGVLTLSTFTHDWRSTLPDEVPPVWRLIAGYWTPAVIYWIARQAPLREKPLAAIYGCFALLGVYLGLTGMAEISQQWWLVFPKHIADPELGLHFGRARGPMVQSPSYGLYLGVCVMCALTWRNSLPRQAKLLVLACLPVLLAGVFFSYTRSVWLGTGVGLFILSALTLRGQMRRVVLTGMVACAALVAATKSESILSVKREGSFSASRDSAAMRASFTYVSWKMFLDRPVLGCGFGHFAEEKLPYLHDRSYQRNLQEIRSLSHHNTFLSLLTETGVVGLGLFLALCWRFTFDAWRLWQAAKAPAWVRAHGALFLAAFGVYLLQLMFHELTFTSIDNSLIFFLAGITAGLQPWTASVARAPVAIAERQGTAWGRPAPQLG